MIDWLQASLLAVLQGLTEFLPISSSAHLVIPSLVLSWPDQGLAFDVAVHVGTLTAVLFYYRSDLFTLATGCSRALAERKVNEHSRMVGFLVAATVPVAVVGVVVVLVEVVMVIVQIIIVVAVFFQVLVVD